MKAIQTFITSILMINVSYVNAQMFGGQITKNTKKKYYYATSGKCGAYISPTVWKEILCHNLGADTSADPFIPSASIQGAKYQWGAQTEEVGRYVSQADQQSNTPFNWISNPVKPDGSWLDSGKTVNDPCPSGYRIPTKEQWSAIISNNTMTNVGPTGVSYIRGVKLGDDLFLPAAGSVDNSPGIIGYYWSSTIYSSNEAYFFDIFFNSDVSYNNRSIGISVRCIKE